MKAALVCVLFLIPFDGNADVYKCKDASGKTHYQDSACSYGKKAEAFNDSARNITGSNSRSVYEAGAEIDARSKRTNQRAPTVDANTPLGAPVQSEVSAAPRMVPADKCYSGVWKDRTWGCPFTRPETAAEAKARQEQDAARREQIQPVPTTRFDQFGNPYTDFGNNGPLLNHRTGQMCQRMGPNVRCD